MAKSFMVFVLISRNIHDYWKSVTIPLLPATIFIINWIIAHSYFKASQKNCRNLIQGHRKSHTYCKTTWKSASICNHWSTKSRVEIGYWFFPPQLGKVIYLFWCILSSIFSLLQSGEIVWPPKMKSSRFSSFFLGEVTIVLLHFLQPFFF